MNERNKQDSKAVKFWPSTYAKGFALGEKAWNDCHPWEYVDKISSRFDPEPLQRWRAFHCGLSEGYHATRELNESMAGYITEEVPA